MATETSIGYSINGGPQSTVMRHLMPVVLLIGEDTIRWKLYEFRERLMTCIQFFSSLSLFLSTLGVVLTADHFRDFAYIPGGMWSSVYLCMTLFSFVWLVVSGLRFVRNFRKLSCDYAMEDIYASKKATADVTAGLRAKSVFDSTPLNQ